MINKIENFVNATNSINDAMNKIIPLVNDYFSNNEIKFKADFTPYEKNYKQLQAIIAPFQEVNKVMIYFSFCKYSKMIKFKTSYKVQEFSCAYIENHYYIGTDWQERQSITIEQVKQAQINLEAIDAKIRELESEKSKLKRFLNK